MTELVFIGHKLRGNIKRNIKEVQEILREIHRSKLDVIPCAPYLTCLQYLDDNKPKERRLGMQVNKFYIENRLVQKYWATGDELSKGMRQEVSFSLDNDIPVECFHLNLQPDLEKTVQKYYKSIEKRKPTGLRRLAGHPAIYKGQIADLENWQKELVHAAKEAREKAVAPLSNYKVGAALLTTTGKIYTGANYESATYTLTAHAEMTAINKAIFDKKRKFKAIAVYVGEGPGIPCGLCRQKIFEADDTMQVIGANSHKEARVTTIIDLLPLGFSLKDLGIDISKY
ncbi:MAG: cytidine deaminase [Candidatus Woesearchaeota archaeon]